MGEYGLAGPVSRTHEPGRPEQAARQNRTRPPTAAGQSNSTPRKAKTVIEDSYVTPLVRKLAAGHGVSLSAVAGTGVGTGVGGRITAGDVRAAAGLPREAPRPRQRTSPVASLQSVAARTVNVPSVWNGGGGVNIDPFARNPLVDDARQAVPATYQAALREGPAPTLFAGGDLPLWLASGADPQLLLELPWQVRHAAAQADGREFAAVLEAYTGPDAAELASMGWGPRGTSRPGGGTDDGGLDYWVRVQAWLKGPPGSSRPDLLL
jgi:hypothetical protein